MFGFLKKKVDVETELKQLASAIACVSAECAKILNAADEDIHADFELLTLEFMWFFIHITDRFAFLTDKQDYIVNTVMTYSQIEATRLIHGESKIEALKKDFEYSKTYFEMLDCHFNDRTGEYAKYKELLPGKVIPDEEVVVYCFCDLITREYIKSNEYILLRPAIASILLYGWKKLEIEKVFKRIK